MVNWYRAHTIAKALVVVFHIFHENGQLHFLAAGSAYRVGDTYLEYQQSMIGSDHADGVKNKVFPRCPNGAPSSAKNIIDALINPGFCTSFTH